MSDSFTNIYHDLQDDARELYEKTGIRVDINTGSMYDAIKKVEELRKKHKI